MKENIIAVFTNLECHLCCKDEFVALKETSWRIHEHRVRDAVNQVQHSWLHIFRRFGSFNGFLEHNAERLTIKIN
jgi:hypothetical protein